MLASNIKLRNSLDFIVIIVLEILHNHTILSINRTAINDASLTFGDFDLAAAMQIINPGIAALVVKRLDAAKLAHGEGEGCYRKSEVVTIWGANVDVAKLNELCAQ